MLWRVLSKWISSKKTNSNASQRFTSVLLCADRKEFAMLCNVLECLVGDAVRAAGE